MVTFFIKGSKRGGRGGGGKEGPDPVFQNLAFVYPGL